MIRIVGLIFLFIFTAASPAIGADIFCVQDSKQIALDNEYREKGISSERSLCRLVAISGPILEGDYKKLISIYNARVRPNIFTLHSPGGSVAEALKIGRFFRKYLIAVIAPNDGSDDDQISNIHGRCASACALIFFGSVDRAGEVGLHRPWTNDPKFAQLSPEMAANQHREMIGLVTDYLREMEAPESIIELMTSTGPSEISWVNTTDMAKLKYPPSFIDWIRATCGDDPSQDYFTLKVALGMLHRRVTSEEMRALRDLEGRRNVWNTCHLEKIDHYQAQLSAPSIK